jgi:hypothetical protein
MGFHHGINLQSYFRVRLKLIQDTHEAASSRQCRLNGGLFSCLIPFASHGLFIRAFSTASAFLAITVK